MCRKHDWQYSILQNSILIRFKIHELEGIHDFYANKSKIKYQRFRLAVSTNSYISTYYYFAYNQRFGTLHLTVQAI